MDDIRFICSCCGQHLSASSDMAGSTIECPNCHTPLHIPHLVESNRHAEEDISLGDLQTAAASYTKHPARADDAKMGTLLAGRYELIRELGQGGFGKVYEAMDRKLGRKVAIKQLTAAPSNPTTAEAVTRFRREATLIAGLNHPNLVTVFDTGQDTGGDYIVMELIDGGTLKKYIRERGKLPVTEALTLLTEITRGLSYAHKKNLVHRDIKPANILLQRRGDEIVPKIADFGLARQGRDSEISATGQSMGTSAYMAPEQRDDTKGVNHTADIYALGKTLYEMVTGEVPYNVDTSSIPPIPGLREAILKCVRNDPVARYFSVDEFMRDLGTVGRSIQDRESGNKRRAVGAGSFRQLPHARLLGAATAVGGAVVLATFAVRWLKDRLSDTSPDVQLPAATVSVQNQEQRQSAKTAQVTATTVAALAAELASGVEPFGLPIAVGNFLYEGGELMSPFSAMLRDELERALSYGGRLTIVSRERFAGLPPELLEPGNGNASEQLLARLTSISEVRGIVRGRFYYQPPDVTVYAEFLLLADGTVRKTKAVLPAQGFAARAAPASTASSSDKIIAGNLTETMFHPSSLAQSQANLADVQSRLPRITHDFKLQLIVKESRRDFAEGETVSYQIWSDTGCHIAVLCHQVDGSTVQLFPNALNRDTWLAADTRLDIPGSDEAGFRIVISPPFGADVVQVIACTEASSLHRLVGLQSARPDTPTVGAYRSLDRGMVIETLSGALEKKKGTTATAQWSEAHVVVNTYPKMR